MQMRVTLSEKDIVSLPELTLVGQHRPKMAATLGYLVFRRRFEEEISGQRVDEDVFSLEQESKNITKIEEDLVYTIDKEIETSIVNITRKQDHK